MGEPGLQPCPWRPSVLQTGLPIQTHPTPQTPLRPSRPGPGIGEGQRDGTKSASRPNSPVTRAAPGRTCAAGDPGRGRHSGPHPSLSARVPFYLQPPIASRRDPGFRLWLPWRSHDQRGGERGGASCDRLRATADDVRARARSFSAWRRELRKESGSGCGPSGCSQTDLRRTSR